jgi:hypothetical protein
MLADAEVEKGCLEFENQILRRSIPVNLKYLADFRQPLLWFPFPPVG